MKTTVISYIHPDDEELIKFLKERGCIIDSIPGSHYYYADAEKEKKNKIREEVKVEFGLDLKLAYLGVADKKRYARFMEEQIKKDLEMKKVVVLRETTMEDEITHGWLDDPLELFKIFLNLEVIVNKKEDSWEAGCDIWTVYTRDGEEIDFYSWKSVEDFLIEKGISY